MISTKTIILSLVLTMVGFGSCSSSNAKSADATAEQQDTAPSVVFNADSAYSYVKAQCDFGPRVPGTKAHQQTADYLVAKLRSYGANVIEQTPELTTFDGSKFTARNIIGEFNPDKEQRILLLAHWDSRPWADNDSDPKNISKPVMGANDGASGVGVLLELARQFSLKMPNIGVDILFTDLEDWGNTGAGDNDDTWALGTQYWVANMHRPNYKPIYGVLLDMVGTNNARFGREYFSAQYAPSVLDAVWNEAAKAGYSDYFVNTSGGAITDDHVFVCKAGIPTIDIIDSGSSNSGFFSGWHTTHDTMDVIDTATLKAVGQTLTNLIYGY